MNLRGYFLITAAYWAFTLTDGALRMLVLLTFHERGLNALALAFLFVLYEACGIFTNLLGGWIGARHGLRYTLYAGLALQVVALTALSFVGLDWALGLVIASVMGLQALSGVAKDLTKMSAKSSVKLFATGNTAEAASSRLFRWVALLTGSKNALKGVGFFIGGALLQAVGFQHSLWIMAAALAVTLVLTLLLVREDLGRSKQKPGIRQLLAKQPAINWLSAARLFLFGSRDVWFVVGVPVYLASQLGWSFAGVGSFFAAWVIGYGIVQAAAPRLSSGSAASARGWAGALLILCIALAAVSQWMPSGRLQEALILGGLGIFGLVFAINSSVHSYLVLAYSKDDDVSLNVGFYYMANANGRLLGTLLSGLLYLLAGLPACLWGAVGMVAIALLCSLRLPERT